jgi:alanine racemase
MRHTYSVINLENLKYNFLNIRRKAESRKIAAVVKADAYGHGAVECAKALNSLGEKRPDYYAVALTEEALELRKAGITDKIICFAPFNKEQIPACIEQNIIPTVFTQNQLDVLSAQKNDSRISIEVKIDTGMSRIGIHYSEAYKFILNLSKDKRFHIDGVYTHLSTSDEYDKAFSRLQMERFSSVITRLKKEGIEYGLAHCANSGALLDLMPEAGFDMVRPGIILYGYRPSLETSESIDLKPVMSLESEIDSIIKLFAGESVSYGRTYRPGIETNIASVPIGYADGYCRNLSNKAFSIINGKMFRQSGNVCMDRIMFDIGDDLVKKGDKVILLGSNGSLKFDAWDWATVLNTIPYEITCGISRRVPRIYV